VHGSEVVQYENRLSIILVTKSKITVLKDVATCSLVEIYRRFREVLTVLSSS
jgi:hypothetical protein